MELRSKMHSVRLLMGILCILAPLSLWAQEEAASTGARISEKNLAMMPCKYVGKSIATEALFMDVSTTLLDDVHHDAKTRFDSKKYINFRTIGHGMYHYFMRQTKADIIATLKEGDKIVISGKVTSCADKHAWIDVDSVVKAPTE